MKLFAVIMAVFIILFGLRLLFSGLKSIISYFKADSMPDRAKKTAFRDLVLGILFLVLALAMLT